MQGESADFEVAGEGDAAVVNGILAYIYIALQGFFPFFSLLINETSSLNVSQQSDLRSVQIG